MFPPKFRVIVIVNDGMPPRLLVAPAVFEGGKIFVMVSQAGVLHRYEIPPQHLQPWRGPTPAADYLWQQPLPPGTPVDK